MNPQDMGIMCSNKWPDIRQWVVQLKVECRNEL